MILQNSDIHKILNIWDEKQIKVADNTIVYIFSLLNYLKEGDIIEYNNIKIESLGNNLLFISTFISQKDIGEDLKEISEQHIELVSG